MTAISKDRIKHLIKDRQADYSCSYKDVYESLGITPEHLLSVSQKHPEGAFTDALRADKSGASEIFREGPSQSILPTLDPAQSSRQAIQGNPFPGAYNYSPWVGNPYGFIKLGDIKELYHGGVLDKEEHDQNNSPTYRMMSPFQRPQLRPRGF